MNCTDVRVAVYGFRNQRFSPLLVRSVLCADLIQQKLASLRYLRVVKLRAIAASSLSILSARCAPWAVSVGGCIRSLTNCSARLSIPKSKAGRLPSALIWAKNYCQHTLLSPVIQRASRLSQSQTSCRGSCSHLSVEHRFRHEARFARFDSIVFYRATRLLSRLLRTSNAVLEAYSIKGICDARNLCRRR